MSPSEGHDLPPAAPRARDPRKWLDELISGIRGEVARNRGLRFAQSVDAAFDGEWSGQLARFGKRLDDLREQARRSRAAPPASPGGVPPFGPSHRGGAGSDQAGAGGRPP